MTNKIVLFDSNVKFYKYLSPEASIFALNNRVLKWSKCNLFNDPFEMPEIFNYPFDGKKIWEALTEELADLTFETNEPVGNYKNKYLSLVMAARKKRNKGTKAAFKEYMADGLTDEFIESIYSKQKESQEQLQSMRDSLAVLSVTKNYKSLLMWAHYAQNHTGCVFKFRCLPEKDRPLCVARKVKYQTEYPIRATLEKFIKHLTGQQELDDENLFEKFAFTKSREWEYEEEWRCIIKLKDHRSGFDYNSIIPEELESVYLGTRIDKNNKKQIINTLSIQFPQTSIYQADISSQKYELVFKQIR
ncbi:MAG: DUF2971 domain-containing protein [Nitrosomonas sp.]|jgi:hypothetical protein|nr:DUF2971 domain-containing protein [Nitrosomonas sp.]